MVEREDVEFLSNMARGLFFGAVTGASVITLLIVFSVNFSGNIAEAVLRFLIVGLMAFVGAFLVWFFGLVVVGLPVWLALHRLGCRNIVAVCLLGFVATFFVSLALRSHFFALPPPDSIKGAQEWYAVSEGPIEIDYKLTRLGWRLALQGSGELGALGIVVAVGVWTAAYRPRIWRKLNASGGG